MNLATMTATRARAAAASLLSAALVLAGGAVLAAAPATEAGAYTPATIPTATGTPDGPAAQVTATTGITPSVVAPGQHLSYVVTATATAPHPGAGTGRSDLTSLSIHLVTDPRAPLDRAPLATDVTWSDGLTRPLHSATQEEDGSWTLLFAAANGGGDGGLTTLGTTVTATATLPATLATTADGATPLEARTTATATIDPTVSWAKGETRMTAMSDDGCTATFMGTATMEGGGYGGWLAEMRLAVPTARDELVDTAPVIVFRDTQGRNATATVMAEATTDLDDTGRPVDTAADLNRQVTPAQARAGISWDYEQSVNWPSDLTTFTGTTWVGDGTTLTWSQQVEDTQCVPGTNTGASWTQHVPDITISSMSPSRRASHEHTATATIDAPAPVATTYSVAKTSTDTGTDSETAVIEDATTTLTRGWDVAVTATGPGTSPAITDTPTVPEGLVLTSLAADGTPVEADPATPGTYTLSPGLDFTQAGTRTIHVTATYGLDGAALTQASWAALAACSAAEPAAGLGNTVHMDGDTTTGDDAACTRAVPAATPRFSVTATTTDTTAVVGPSTRSLTRTYRVTVANTGTVAGTSAPVLDTPAVPAGMSVASVSVDGSPVEADAQGAYLLSPGHTLAPGDAPATHEVTVTYAVDPAHVHLDDLASCAVLGADGRPAGILNTVAMAGDSTDGDDLVCTSAIGQAAFTVRQDLSAGQAEAVGTGEDGSFTVSYTVTVTNTGTRAGTFADLAVTPHLPTGFSGTLSPSTIPGERLAAGERRAYTLTLTGTVDTATAGADGGAGWAAAATCSTDGQGDEQQGLFSRVAVTSTEGADGETNTDTSDDDACAHVVPPTAQFTVSKAPAPGQRALIDVGEANELSTAWQVVVTNTGQAAGTFPVLTDLPSAPAGLSVTGATVDGRGATLTDGVLTLSPGEALAAGATRRFDVVLTYTLDQAAAGADGAAGWVAASTCSTAGAGDPAQGLFNRVELGAGNSADADGADNNDACVRLRAPQAAFEVTKTVAADQPLPVTVAEDGTFTTRYTIRVTNTGRAAGTFPTLTDVVTLPTGFTGEVSPSTIPGEEIGPGLSRTYTVTLTGAVDAELAAANGGAGWAAASACQVTGGAEGLGDPSLGLYNRVLVGQAAPGTTGDATATDNAACAPVAPPTAAFSVRKSLSTPQRTPLAVAADGTVTVSYDVVVQNTGRADGTAPTVTDTPVLPSGAVLRSATLGTGREATELPVDGATLVLAPAGTLTVPAGTSRTLTVTLVVDVSSPDVDRAAAARCVPGQDGAAPSGGLVNTVSLLGATDTDGTANNAACAPLAAPGDATFSVGATTTDTPLVLRAPTTTATRTWTVTVTNTGTAAGTSPSVLDVPAAPAGFTITSVRVDGTPATAQGGTWAVTAGDTLAAGASAQHTVAVTYAVAAAGVSPQDWAALATCTAASPEGGLTSTVTMASDASGPADNTDCAPVRATASLSLSKTLNGARADTAPGTTVAEGSTLHLAYHLSNTGALPLQGLVLADEVRSGQVDGATSPTDLACPADTLAPGQEVECTATYPAPASGAQHTDVATATATVPEQAAPALAPGATGQVGASDAANAVTTREAVYAVSKTALTPAPLVLGSVDPQDLTASWAVTVRNTNDTAGSTGAVLDTPATRPGLQVREVSVDGAPATPAGGGSYLVSQGESLPAGGSATHTVVVTYRSKAATLTQADWETLATCQEGGAGQEATGLRNRVDMAGDSDGEEGNEACLPVAGTPRLELVASVGGKDANSEQGAAVVVANELVRVLYTVTNTGNQPLTGLQVADPRVTPATIAAGDATALTCPVTTLAVGATTTCAATVRSPWDAGARTDWAVTASATAPTAPAGPATVTDTDAVHLVTPAFQVEKKDAGERDVVLTGRGMRTFERPYRITLTNTGPVAATSFGVYDMPSVPSGMTLVSLAADGVKVPEQDGAFLLTTGTFLEPGQVRTFEIVVTYGVDPAALSASQWGAVTSCDPLTGEPTVTVHLGIRNAVFMRGNAGKGTDTVCTPVVSDPVVRLTTSLNGQDANQAPGVQVEAGSTVKVTYHVVNAGNRPLEKVTVTDTAVTPEALASGQATAITCPATELGVGSAMDCTATLRAPAAGGVLAATGTVTARPVGSTGGTVPTVTDTDPAHAHVPGTAVPTPQPSPSATPVPSTSPSPVATAAPTTPATATPSPAPVPSTEPTPAPTPTPGADPTSEPTAPSAPATSTGVLSPLPHQGTTSPGTALAATSATHRLARTGANVLGGLLLSSGLALAGALLLAVRRQEDEG